MSDFEIWLEQNKHLARTYDNVFDEDDRALARAAFEAGVIALARRLGVTVEEIGDLLPPGGEARHA